MIHFETTILDIKKDNKDLYNFIKIRFNYYRYNINTLNLTPMLEPILMVGCDDIMECFTLMFEKGNYNAFIAELEKSSVVDFIKDNMYLFSYKELVSHFLI